MESKTNASKDMLIAELDRRVADKILEKSNADLLKKLIIKSESLTEAISIAELGTTYKRTGLHFDKRLEKPSNTISYFKKNNSLSFVTNQSKTTHKLIIGDNYPALLNLLIQYRHSIDVIYIDPPYGKDSLGEFAQTNYENALTRDNLISMLYPRLILAKQLLSSSGVIFVSIDDRNQAYIKCLMDEVFGESSFLLNVPRITKKGGKSTQTIAKNNDYVLGYTLSSDIVFSQEEKTDLSKYKYEDQYVETRGKYALTQTLDYDSLQYSTGMDYEIEFEGEKFYPGGNKEEMEKRHNGIHGVTDWVWRWSKSAVEWGIKNDFLVVKNNRIYTKSYLKCRKKNGKNEIEFIDPTKAFTTLSFIDNKYSNDNGKKELDSIFDNGSVIFKNPKPSSLTTSLINMVCSKKDAIILDFFGGSGTTAQSVLELNSKDGGERQFILCQLNEVTDTTPNGIAYDVTAKRLKRIMTGCCYDGTKDFKLARDGFIPYKENLDVYEINSVANFEKTEGKTAFDVIDEELYGLKKFDYLKDKIQWVCNNFEPTQIIIESDESYIKRENE